MGLPEELCRILILGAFVGGHFFIFLGVVSEFSLLRFSSAAKHTRDTLGFPHITSILLGVGNLRQRWYVDGIARMEFNNGVPIITL